MLCYPLKSEFECSAIVAYLRGIERIGLNLNSVLLVKNGVVVAEHYTTPFTKDTPHELFSACKSLVSIAVGIAVYEKKLKLNDRVIDFFPEKLPANVSNSLKKLTVRDLLIMSSGQAEETWGKLKQTPDGDWVKTFLSLPLTYNPGERYVYSNSNSYILSAIIQKLYDKSLNDFLYERVLHELGIQRRPWFTCPRGISQGTHGLRLTTREAALIGQLLLQKGCWNGKQLIPKEWLKEATKQQISTKAVFHETDRQLGYGYHFWLGQHGSFRCEGAYGQEILIFPDEDAVLVTFGGMRFGAEMQENLNLIWQLVYPALAKDHTESQTEVSGKFIFHQNTFGLTALQLQPKECIDLVMDEDLVSIPLDDGEIKTEYWFRGQPELSTIKACTLSANLYEIHICMLHSAYRLTFLIQASEKEIHVVPLVTPEFNASEVKEYFIGFNTETA